MAARRGRAASGISPCASSARGGRGDSTVRCGALRRDRRRTRTRDRRRRRPACPGAACDSGAPAPPTHGASSRSARAATPRRAPPVDRSEADTRRQHLGVVQNDHVAGAHVVGEVCVWRCSSRPSAVVDEQTRRVARRQWVLRRCARAATRSRTRRFVWPWLTRRGGTGRSSAVGGRHDQAEVLPRGRHGDPPAGRADEQALLDEERLVHVFDRLVRLADARSPASTARPARRRTAAQRSSTARSALSRPDSSTPKNAEPSRATSASMCRRRASRRSRAPGAAAGWRCGACPASGGRSRRRRRRRWRPRGCRRHARRSLSRSSAV